MVRGVARILSSSFRSLSGRSRSLESPATTDKTNTMTLPTYGSSKVDDFALAAIACRRWFCFCLTFLCQVLVTVLMCLLDWLMVIPVSKLMSKTNEDEDISLLNRVFKVILQAMVLRVFFLVSPSPQTFRSRLISIWCHVMEEALITGVSFSS